MSPSVLFLLTSQWFLDYSESTHMCVVFIIFSGILELLKEQNNLLFVNFLDSHTYNRLECFKTVILAWGDSSAIKATMCVRALRTQQKTIIYIHFKDLGVLVTLPENLGSVPQLPWQLTVPSATPVLENSVPFSTLSYYTHLVHKHSYRQNTCTHK